jgi:hypothetical protein
MGQMKADAAAKLEDARAKIDKRNRRLDAKAAAIGADWAEADAADALDFAAWAVGNAQLAMLDASTPAPTPTSSPRRAPDPGRERPAWHHCARV